MFDDGLLRSGEAIDSEIAPDGRFVLANVRPGPLTLLVQNTGDTYQEVFWGLARLVVSGDSAGLSVQMRPGLRLHGEVRFESTTQSAPSKANLGFILRPGGPATLDLSYGVNGSIDEDGRFAMGGLLPGSYFLDHQNRTQWSIASIRQGGVERIFGTLEVDQADVSDVVVTLVDRPASLSGRLLVAPDALVTDYTVVAFPADPTIRAARSRAIYSASLDTTGRFTMPSVLPGDYLVAVTDDIEVNAWFDPRVLEQLSQGGIAIRIAAGEAKTQDLSIRQRY
jgi:hypothetical protein